MILNSLRKKSEDEKCILLILNFNKYYDSQVICIWKTCVGRVKTLNNVFVRLALHCMILAYFPFILSTFWSAFILSFIRLNLQPDLVILYKIEIHIHFSETLSIAQIFFFKKNCCCWNVWLMFTQVKILCADIASRYMKKRTFFVLSNVKYTMFINTNCKILRLSWSSFVKWPEWSCEPAASSSIRS